MVDSSSAMYCRSRRAESLRIASGSRRRRPGLPPTRPRALAARSPALVRSRIRARSSSAAAPSTWRANLPCGVAVSIGSRSDEVFAHRLDPLDHLEQVDQRAGQPVDPGDHQDVAAPDPAHRPGQLGARPVGARRLLLEDDLRSRRP